MIDAVEIQLAVVRLFSECGIGEIDVPRFAHYDIAGRIEPLAFPLVGQHFDLALLIGAGHAAQARLAGVETAVGVEGVAAGAMGVRAEDFGGMAGRPFQEAVAGGVAEDQVAIFGPGGAFREAVAIGQLAERDIGEILRGSEESRKGRRRNRFGPSGSFARAFVLQLDVVDHLFDALHLLRDLGGLVLLNLAAPPCRSASPRPASLPP